MQCLFLVVLLLLLLSVKLLSAEFAAVSELSDEKFNGPRVIVTRRNFVPYLYASWFPPPSCG